MNDKTVKMGENCADSAKDIIESSKMEKALWLLDENAVFSSELKYSRAYVGSENCQKKILGPQKAVEIVKSCEKNQLCLTFVLPPCTDKGTEKARLLLDALSHLNWKGEIVANDIGILSMIVEYGMIPICGRLLLPVYRDPRFFDRHSIIRADSLGWSMSTLEFFHKGFGVRHFEIQSPWKMPDLTPYQEKGFSFSIHWPLNIITRSRNCILAIKPQKSSGNAVYLGNCGQPCRKFYVQLDIGLKTSDKKRESAQLEEEKTLDKNLVYGIESGLYFIGENFDNELVDEKYQNCRLIINGAYFDILKNSQFTEKEP